MSKIFLRKLDTSDADNIVRWRNSPAVRKNLYSQEELTKEQHLDYFNNVVKAGKCVQYIIVSEDNGDTDIGTVFIKNIDKHSKKGEFGMFIGEESARGKGYAKFAVSAILEVAFNELFLNRVYLSVMKDNIYAIRAYKSAGFIIEGTLKEDYLRNDAYVDVVLMGITRNQWHAMQTGCNS